MEQEALVLEIPAHLTEVLCGSKGEHLKGMEEAVGYRIFIYANRNMNEEAFAIRFLGTREEAGKRLERLKK